MGVLEVESCGLNTIPEYCILLWILNNSALAASKYLTTSSSISLHKSASHARPDYNDFPEGWRQSVQSQCR